LFTNTNNTGFFKKKIWVKKDYLLISLYQTKKMVKIPNIKEKLSNFLFKN
tara:strand:+ start:184 stop:333 length:150 start_codon:yes stop_codon:yes gene_type:complete